MQASPSILNVSSNTPPQVSSFQPLMSFKSLWKKISSFVLQIFKKIASFFNPATFFSSIEIALLKDNRVNKDTPHEGLLGDKHITLTALNTSLTQEISEEYNDPSEPIYIAYGDALENLRSLAREFSVMGVDVIYENHIIERLESIQNLAPSLPPLIKSITKLVVEMGDKAAKPLFKRFAEQKAQVIDPTLRKIFRTLVKPNVAIMREKLSTNLLSSTTFTDDPSASDYINPVLTWLSTPEDHRKPLKDFYAKDKNFNKNLIDHLEETAGNFWQNLQESESVLQYDSLEKQLSQEFKGSKISFKENLNTHYIEPILNWLLLSNHSTPLANVFGKLDPHKEELVDKIFEHAISLLVEIKIDEYTRILEQTVEHRLDEIVHQMMQKNASRITDFFSERISELLSSMAFTEAVDHLIHQTLSMQIKAIIECENEVKMQKKLLEKAQTIAKVAPKDEKSLEAQIRAQNHLNSVLQYGSEEAFFQHIREEKLSKLEICNPSLQEIIEQEIGLTLQGKDPSAARKASEQNLYITLAENLINLLLPTKKQINSKGEIEEIDPFTELWNRLYFTEEFYDLINHAEGLTQEFITPDTVALFGKVKQPTIEVVKLFFKTTTKDLLKKYLGKLIQKTFEKLTHPPELNELTAEHILPMINTNLVELFIRQELSRNVNAFVPLLYKLINADNSQRKLELRTIQNTLIELSRSKFQQFNPNEFYSKETQDKSEGMILSGLTSLDWLDLTDHVIVKLEEEILNLAQKDEGFDKETLTTKKIKNILNTIFIAKPQKNNPAFGELSTDLLFEIGEFKNKNLINYFIKDTLSGNITEAVEPWRQSYEKLIQTMSQSIRKSVLNPDSLKNLFSNEDIIEPAFTEQKLAHQIHVTSCLAHDIIMGVAQAKGSVAKFAVKKVISNAPEDLNQLITNVYKKLLSNKTFNQNLIANICQKIFFSLGMAADTISRRENIKAHHLAGGTT